MIGDTNFAANNSESLTDNGLAEVCARTLALWMHYAEAADHRGVLNRTFQSLADAENRLGKPKT